MADIRNPVGAAGYIPPGRPANPTRTEAIRTAQRAFFETALAGAQAAAPTVGVSAPAVVAAAGVRAVAPDPQSPPNRILRPGSLLDIKV